MEIAMVESRQVIAMKTVFSFFGPHGILKFCLSLTHDSEYSERR